MLSCSSTPWVTGDNKAAIQIWAFTMQGKNPWSRIMVVAEFLFGPTAWVHAQTRFITVSQKWEKRVEVLLGCSYIFFQLPSTWTLMREDRRENRSCSLTYFCHLVHHIVYFLNSFVSISWNHLVKTWFLSEKYKPRNFRLCFFRAYT